MTRYIGEIIARSRERDDVAFPLRASLILFLFLVGNSESLRAEDTTATTELPTVRVRARRALVAAPSEFSGESLEVGRTTDGSIGQVLKRLPALTPKESGGEGSSPTFLIRGQDPIQNRIFLDDVPLTDAEHNQSQISIIPLEALSAIDFYAEGTPTFLGEDGASGALNLRLNQPANEQRFGVSLKGGSYGFSRFFGSASWKTGVPGRVAIELTRSNEDFVYFDDNATPFNPDDDRFERRANNQFRRAVLLPYVRLFQNANHEVSFFNLTSIGDTEVPGPVRLPTQGKLSELHLLNAVKYGAQISPRVRSEALVFGRWQESKLIDEGGTGGLTPKETKSLTLGAKERARFQWGKTFHSEAITGLTLENFNENFNLASSAEGQHLRLALPLGLSTQYEWEDARLTFRPALLAHYYHYDLKSDPNFPGLPRGDSNKDFMLWSPRLGASWRVIPSGQVQVRASIGNFYRAPSLYEMFGDPSGVTPSQDLTDEKVFKADLGIDGEWRKPLPGFQSFKASATYFYSRADRLITFVQNSQQTRVAVNVGNSQIHGVEAQAQLQSVVGVGARVAANYLMTQNLSEISYEYGKELPGRPPYRWITSLSFEKPWITADYTVAWVGPQYWDLPNLKQLEATSDHSASIALRTRDFGQFILEARNILDTITATSSIGSLQTADNNTGYQGYPAPGRRFYLTWKYEI